MAKHRKRHKKDRTAIEEADVAAARAAAPYRDHPVIRVLGPLSEVADQPPLTTIAIATLGLGLLRQDRAVARAGLRMLSALALATGIKTVVKTSVDRTRPAMLVDHGRYELAKGKDSDDHNRTSFPSGHTAGAVAVARAWGREFPAHRPATLAAAGGIAAIQIPRSTHYPSDVIAGAVIGLVAEAAIDQLFALFDRRAALHSADGTR